MSGTLNWVIGSGGLLGSSIVTETPDGETSWTPPRRIDWSSPAAWTNDFSDLVARFVASSTDRRWRVWWCAGRGTVSSSQEVLDEESSALGLLLGAMRAAGPDWLGRGELVFSSSAGSIYAGTTDVVIGPGTAPAPLTSYGRMKLAAERAVEDFGSVTGVHTVVARITNLFGPKQDMSKSQGLITAICAAMLRRKPIPIFVSLGTIRNYVYAEDAAHLMWRIAQTDRRSAHSTHIVSSPANLSVGGVLKIVEDVVGERALVRLVSHPDSAVLSRSVFFDPALESVRIVGYTPVHEGVAAVHAGLLRSWQCGVLNTDRGVA